MIPFLSDLGGADGSPAGPASPAPRRSVTGAALAAPSVAAGGDRARKVLDGLRGRDRQGGYYGCESSGGEGWRGIYDEQVAAAIID
uniref:Uncharacterized protein n=1 Tax=Oryza punctata TaxID=4537 RepID=A0A0E0KH54_ORYPU